MEPGAAPGRPPPGTARWWPHHPRPVPVAGAGVRSDDGGRPLWTSWLVLPARPRGRRWCRVSGLRVGARRRASVRRCWPWWACRAGRAPGQARAVAAAAPGLVRRVAGASGLWLIC